MGGKDLLKRKWKGLAEFVSLECDGRDLTPKLKELKVHAIVFLNIPRLVACIIYTYYISAYFITVRYYIQFCIISYGGGTRPWNRAMGAAEPSTEDGLIEVVGLTTYQLVSKFRASTFLIFFSVYICLIHIFLLVSVLLKE